MNLENAVTDISPEARFCRVAVNMPGPKSSYVYRVPDNLELKPGCLVEMPLGRRKGFGVVVTDVFGADQLTEIEKGYSIKPISKLMDEKFSLSANELQFYVWMSQYYHYSLGLLVHDCLPPMMKRPRPLDLSSGRGEKIEEVLSVSQQDIFQKILSHEDTFWRHYIHGVTGSGKSLIYLHLIQQMIASGKSVLFMLPEINLTPQFVDYFKKYLSCTVIAYHSALSDGEKYQVWCHLMEQQGPVMVLGVRSSIFLPISQLGLVIVDEEHDASFKQTDRCPYNARDLAIKKAQIYDVPIVMGSATPAVENFQNFKLKPSPKTSYYEIRKRVRGSFPNIELLDTRNFPFDDPCWPLLPQTIKSIQEAFDLNEQVLVFVNRLGFANFVQCPGCGHTFKDPNTETNLRFFKNKNILKSAYSDYQIPVPDICPECGNMKLLQQGFGTERLQMILKDVFPDKVIERFDREEIRNTDQLEEVLQNFHDHKIDVFVGTQMLSKGHNFERVNRVFILGIDSQMNFPDFRAMERTYQLLTQVLGRAGRFSQLAKVTIQTMSPENSFFEHILRHDFESFYHEELKIRQMAQLPPFSKVAMIYITAKKREQAMQSATRLVDLIHQKISKQNVSLPVDVLGPAPAMLEKRTGQFTWQLMLKSPSVNDLHRVLELVSNWENDQSSIHLKIDVDPYHCF